MGMQTDFEERIDMAILGLNELRRTDNIERIDSKIAVLIRVRSRSTDLLKFGPRDAIDRLTDLKARSTGGFREGLALAIDYLRSYL